ncbi:hypothetical protein [Streptomyces griseus]|uniref:hypothetical protein n=1 Tax=Streptomyces griseus TaxID=1911 RepID=UPI000AB627C4|nr:hypothetical protein [Streptomyces griseus]
MTRTSGWTGRRRCGSALPASLGWVLTLMAVVLCCSPAAAYAHHGDAAPVSHARALTPVPTAASVVTADAPGERGIGSSCHGATNHSTPVVLPGPAAPVALPCPSAVAPPGPLAGAGGIRGPSDDGAGSVNRLRLQVQRI